MIANIKYILEWKSKGLSDESIITPATSDDSISPLISHLGNKTCLKFHGSYLKQNKFTYTHKTIVNIYIVYETLASSSNNSNSILKNSLFGAFELTKNDDIDKYQYSGYKIGFNRRGSSSFPGGGLGQNVIIFGVNMSSSVHIDNKKKDISILGRGPTQGLEHTLPAEKMYSINFTAAKNRFCLSLHYTGANSYLFVNGTEIHKFKAKDLEIVTTPLCIGNISKDWSVDKITGFNGYAYDSRHS